MPPSAPRHSSGSTSHVRLLTGTLVAVGAVLAAAVWPAAQAQSPAMELVVGRNVNMVSGQTLPNGDPYLQRQNEPSVAASTRNPLHLLAGANDYRTVDIPGNFDDGETGDAWLGVFKSFDGGERWQSTLLPGYPQDTSPEGMASPLKAYHAGADPVVRPGTNGLIYFAGLAFNRGQHAPSAIFVSRFVDNNNKENGDPIAYVSTSIVASSTGAEFLDKPWMAVDVPRQGAKVCRLTSPKYAPVLLPGNNSNAASSGKASPKAIGNITQQVRAGTMYVAWAALTTKILADDSADVSSRIMFSKSDDCGATWTKPVQISDPAHKVNQGATIAIDPRTGVVHVAWRQFGLDVNAPDAMMSASSDASGKIGKSRKVHTFPTQRHEDQLLQKLQRAHRMGSAKELVSIKPYDSSTAGQRFRTNAYPTIAVDDESRVYLAWTERGYGGRPLGPGEVPAADGDARIVLSTSRAGSPWTAPTPVDNEAFAGHQLMPSMTYSGGRLMLIYYDLREDAAQVFGPFVDDAQITTGKRHTLDVRAVQALKGDRPQFGASTRVSQYATRTLTLRDASGQFLKEQFQFNPPNLPMFQLGTVPFMGDYIDVAPAPAFVQDAAGTWIHNTANTTAPVFHAVWTDNRDVQQPKGTLGWKDYTKPTTTAAAGANCMPVASGIRNQNVYSARLTMGLVAGSPSNTKPLSVNVPRGFVVFAQNSSYSTKAFRFTIERQPAGGQASFSQLGLLEPEPLLLTVDVKVAPRSMVTRTVYATSANAKEQVPVSVTEIGILDFEPVTGGLTARVILNPDISNPDISNPDISNPDISNPDISNAEVYNPDISNPDISNPDISNPDISNPDISNPDISNIVIANPDISNPDISNPDISNPDISNPDISNPDISNAVLRDGSLTDVTWTLKNEGNTTTSFNVNLFLRQATDDAAKAAGIKTQLVVHKTYKTPAADGCGVLKTQTQMVLVANVLNPEFKDYGEDTTFDPRNPDISNTTLWLEPGGEGKITLRIIDPDPTDTIDINPVEDIPTPVVQADPVNTQDLADPTPEPPATPAPTDPPPTPEPDMVELAYLFPFIPTNTIVDQPLDPIVVRTMAGGSPRAGVQVTLAIATNPAGGRLTGATTVLSDVDGNATFTGLVIERAGVGYQLSASASAAGAVPIISPPFAIKAIPVVTAVWGGPIVYDGLLHPAMCTVTGLNGAAVAGGVITYSSGTAPSNAGTYSATCTFPGDALYEPASDDETLTITKAGSTTTVTCPSGVAYTGTAHEVCAATVTGAGGLNVAVPVTYANNINAGVASANASYGGDANHDGSNGGAGFVIAPAFPVAVATGGTFAYDGQPHGGTCVVTGVNGEMLSGSSTYNPGGATAPVNPGTYTLTCSVAAGGNYMAATDDDVIVIQSPSLAGDWSGSYSWDCGSGRTGSASISLTINAPHFGGWLSNGSVAYLGGTGTASISRFSGAIGNPDQFGNLVRVTVPASAGNYTNNQFDGMLTNPGVLTITGSTLNGDTPVGQDAGCSAISGASGTFVLTKTPSPFVVTTTADSGVGSLRQVMTLANATPVHDTIRFNISGGAGEQVIALDSPLPAVTTPMALLGQTQPGYDGRPMVRVHGAGTAGYGFQLQTTSTVRGLSITGFNGAPAVLVESGGTRSVIDQNYIGTDRTGAAGLGNNAGVMLSGTTNVVVRQNLLSGNAFSGVIISGGNGNEVRNNQIGTGLDGLGILPNADNGVTLYDGAFGTVIDGNLISGNGTIGSPNGYGIDIQQSGGLADVTDTVITNNVIGLDAAGNLIERGGRDYVHAGPGLASLGTEHRGNSGGGIRVIRGSGTMIGTSTGGNTISGNTRAGIQVSGPVAAAPVIRGNRIGTDPTGTMGRGNRRGVEVFGGSAAIVGAPGAGNGNIISGNTGDGVSAGGHTVIENNLVGVDPTASFTIGNGNGQFLVAGNVEESGCCHSGITVTAPNNIVRGNVVGGSTANTQHPGISSRGAGAQPNIIEDNFVGVNPAGTIALPNGVGVASFGSVGTIVRRNTLAHNLLAGAFLMENTQGLVLGGVNAADGNTIRDNPTGVIVGGGAADTGVVTILSNRIYASTSQGIDLGWNGVTDNDGGDGDAGPNGQQNFPVLTNASNSGQTTTVSFTLDGLDINTNHTIQVFATASCGARNGERVVGSFTQQTNGSGDASGTLVLTEQVPPGQFLTATATNGAGGTSEFSACIAVPAGATGNITSATPANGMANEGFLAFRGTNLPAGIGDVVAEVSDGVTTMPGFWFPGPSTSTAGYVRLPAMPLGAATVRLRNNAGTAFTNAFPITITNVPGTPVITAIRDSGLNVVAAPVQAGTTVHVGADGIDTTGAVVRFTQGGNTWDVTGVATSSAAIGMTLQVTLPADASAGSINISIRQGASAFSAPVSIDVAQPAQAGNFSAPYGSAGGGGGSAFGPIPCPAGTVGAGLKGAAGDDIDSTHLWCRTVLPGPSLGNDVYAGGVGGSGGTNYGDALLCPTGAVLIGVHGRAGVVSWGGNVVDTLGTTCRNLGNGVITQSVTVGNASFGTAPFAVTCPAGEEVMAIGGGQGSLLDRIEIYCSNGVAPLSAPQPAPGAVEQIVDGPHEPVTRQVVEEDGRRFTFARHAAIEFRRRFGIGA